MSEARPPRRLRRRILLASAGVFVLTAGVAVWALGPGGPFLVSHLAEGRAVWRLGKLHLEGVSGGALGDLRVARATLSDADGVWAEARDLSVGWEPLRLLTRAASVRQVSAGRVHIFRRPKLTPPRSPGRSLDVDLNALRVARIEIDEPVFGEAAAFALDASLATRGARIDRAMADLRRLDAAGDTLRFNLARKETIHLDAEMTGPPDGFFAAALKANAPLHITARARGDDASGTGAIDARIGEASFIMGDFRWTPDAWSSGGDVRLDLAPAFADIVARAGGAFRIDGEGRRGAQTTFAIMTKAQDGAVTARGALGDDWRPDGAVALDADATRLDRLTRGIVSGRARFAGSLETGKDVAEFKGALTGAGLRLAGVTTDAAGPVRLRATRALVDVEGDVVLSKTRGAGDIAGRLARGGKLTLRSRYDRGAGRLSVREAHLASPVLDIAGDGVLGEGARGLSGTWTTGRLDALDARFRGEARGDWTATGGGDAPVVIAAEGRTRRFATTIQPLDQLLGSTPQLNATLAIKGGVIDVRRIAVLAPRLRAAAFGRVRDGHAVLSLEATARGPVRIGGAELDGVADATGSLTGRLDNPAIAATARMSRIDLAGLAVERPVVTFNFAPAARGREGAVRVEGVVSGEPAVATARLEATRDVFTLADLNVRAAGLIATGAAQFTDAGPTVDVRFAGPVGALAAPLSGQAAGVLSLRPGDGGAAILASSARITGGRLGALAISRLDLDASGPLDAVALKGELRGVASGAPVNLALSGDVRRHGATTHVAAQANGSINGTPVATPEPVRITLTPNAIQARGLFAFGEGSLRVQFDDARGRLALVANMDKAPIGPVLDLLGERATGRATGRIRLEGGDRSLDGELDLAIEDAVLVRRTRDPISMSLTGRIVDGAMTLTGGATSRNGLDARFDARAPVSARARPMRIALAGEGRATWRASGPVDAVWGLVGSLDQNLSGQFEGAGDVRFRIGRLSGAGGFTLAGGRFSDKQSGVELRDIAARVRFDDAGARLEQFSARDLRDGTVTGEGFAHGLKDGEVQVVARDLRLLNRPDARAVASGPLSLKWTADGMTLGGDLNVREATLTTPRPDAGIPQLDVVEINRPDVADGESAVARNDAVDRAALDLRVRAPGRVFVRDRGLDSEWSVDLRVRGTTAAPRVFGEARLVRGRFTLAGRVFDAESGVIRFNGAPDEALITLVAEMSSPEITARIALNGPVADPDIELSSTPSLPQDEILPQALFGRASEDLSALEAAQLAASLAQLAGQASLDIAGTARDLVGLDRLDVRETGTGLRVAGGKYLTRDVYLEVARTGIGETETQVEWRVRPQLFLISAFDPDGDRRLSVRWRREY